MFKVGDRVTYKLAKYGVGTVVSRDDFPHCSSECVPVVWRHGYYGCFPSNLDMYKPASMQEQVMYKLLQLDEKSCL